MPAPAKPTSTAALDADWDALLDGTSVTSPEQGEPRRRTAQQTLARMAQMMDAREGTGPVFDLRTVQGPRSRPADDPEVGAPVAEVQDDASLDVSEVDLLELGAPQEILDDVPDRVAPPVAATKPRVADVAPPPPRASRPVVRVRPWLAMTVGAGAVLVGLWSFAWPRPVATTEIRDAAIGVVATPEVEHATLASSPIETLANIRAPVVEAAAIERRTPDEPPTDDPADDPAAEEPVILEAVAAAPVAADVATVEAARAAFDAERHADAYTIAERRWKQARDNEALAIMVAAACKLDDGRLARRAYRSLGGPQTRETVFVQCRRGGIDLGARTSGYTASELLVRARRAAADGDHEAARSLARESLEIARDPAAIQLVGESACRLGKLDEARRMMARLHPDERATLAATCEAAGAVL